MQYFIFFILFTLGSSCMFTALLLKCSEKNVFALCRYIPRRNTPPRFVALVPQREELDQSQTQATPPGNCRTEQFPLTLYVTFNCMVS